MGSEIARPPAGRARGAGDAAGNGAGFIVAPEQLEEHVAAGDRYVRPWRRWTGAVVPNWLLEHGGVSSGAKVVYARLAQFAGREAVAWPTQTTLAAALSMTRRTVQRHLAELERAGLIEITRSGFPARARYRFLRHPAQR